MPVDPPEPPAEQLDWSEILAWLPRFTDAGFRAGQRAGGEKNAAGERSMPCVAYTEEVHEFIRQLYSVQVVVSLDWGAWMKERGRELWKDPQCLAEASLEDCRMLLTAHVRGDRFTEGHLLRAFETGHIVAILQRVRSLVDGRQT